VRNLLALFLPLVTFASDHFGGGLAGIATLSADARSVGSPPVSVAMYKPENGPTMLVFGGRHLTEYLSVQGSYSWNRNNFVMTGAELGPPTTAYDLSSRATLNTVVAEAMLYFRNRASFARPWLSAGPGLAHFRASARGAAIVRGAPDLPRREYDRTGICFRVAVGIDLRLRGGFALRYSFSETIQRNPISAELRPPAARNLANFQNFFGGLWRF
jgi:hypothetical protein